MEAHSEMGRAVEPGRHIWVDIRAIGLILNGKRVYSHPMRAEIHEEGQKMNRSRLILGRILIITALLAISGCGAGTSDQAGRDAARDQQTAEDQVTDSQAADQSVNSWAADGPDAIVPGVGPGTYEIADGTVAATVPFEFYGMNLLIHARMNGKKVKLLIDNGRLWDDVWFYDGEADSIDLHYMDDGEVGNVTGSGEGEGSTILEGHPVDIDLGSVRFFDQPALISPPEAGWGRFFPGVAGQVSSMLFKHFIVTFDFDKSVMILTKPEAFRNSGEAEAVPMRLGGNEAYTIPITIRMPDSEELDLIMDIDLGGIYPLHIIENDVLSIRRPEDAEKEHLGYGASGEVTGYKGHIGFVRVGSHAMSDVPAVFVEEGANTNPDIVRGGTVGLPLFKRFNITFDYFNSLMYFEPNESFGNPFEETRR